MKSKRLPFFVDKTRLDPYRDFARPHYAGRDPGHDFRHIERILARLDLLAQGMETPRPERLYFLACFHGLGLRLRQDGEFQALVRLFLLDLDWQPDEIEAIFESLARHLWDPQSVEECLVHDANYLDAVGALGIAKAFTTGGARGQSLQETAEIFGRQYLDKIVFRTPVGRGLAEARRVFARDFLAQLQQEW